MLFQGISILPQWKVIRSSKGKGGGEGGSLKSNILKGKGVGQNQKKTLQSGGGGGGGEGGGGYFLREHNTKKCMQQ